MRPAHDALDEAEALSTLEGPRDEARIAAATARHLKALESARDALRVNDLDAVRPRVAAAAATIGLDGTAATADPGLLREALRRQAAAAEEIIAREDCVDAEDRALPRMALAATPEPHGLDRRGAGASAETRLPPSATPVDATAAHAAQGVARGASDHGRAVPAPTDLATAPGPAPPGGPEAASAAGAACAAGPGAAGRGVMLGEAGAASIVGLERRRVAAAHPRGSARRAASAGPGHVGTPARPLLDLAVRRIGVRDADRRGAGAARDGSCARSRDRPTAARAAGAGVARPSRRRR